MSLLILLMGLVWAEPFLSITEPTPIRDPQNLLSQVDQTLGMRVFDQSYRCDREAPFLRSVQGCQLQCQAGFCVVMGCDDDDTEYKKYAVGCGSSNYGIYTDLGDVLDFNQEAFSQVNNNPIRLFLMDLQNFTGHRGSIVLRQIQSTEFTISSTGERVPAFHLIGDFIHSENNFTEWFLVTYSPELPLIAQPLRYRTDALTPTILYGGTTWFRFLGFPEGENH